MDTKFDLNVIRVALEHATFADYRIRDGINTLIKAVELDLEEIGFEPSENTKETQEQLESIITEVETPRRAHNTPLELVDEEVEVREKSDRVDDDVPATPVVNVDEELDEFDPAQ